MTKEKERTFLIFRLRFRDGRNIDLFLLRFPCGGVLVDNVVRQGDPDVPECPDKADPTKANGLGMNGGSTSRSLVGLAG